MSSTTHVFLVSAVLLGLSDEGTSTTPVPWRLGRSQPASPRLVSGSVSSPRALVTMAQESDAWVRSLGILRIPCPPGLSLPNLVGLDYSIAPGQACGLRSSLSDHLGGLPASALP